MIPNVPRQNRTRPCEKLGLSSVSRIFGFARSAQSSRLEPLCNLAYTTESAPRRAIFAIISPLTTKAFDVHVSCGSVCRVWSVHSVCIRLAFTPVVDSRDTSHTLRETPVRYTHCYTVHRCTPEGDRFVGSFT